MPQQHQKQQNRGQNWKKKKNPYTWQERAGFEIAKKLQERKIHLVIRVVKIVGEKIARSVLREVMLMESKGEALLTATGRKRTLGGAFFTLLKERVSVEEYKEIYALEDEQKKKRKKDKVRQARVKLENELVGITGLLSLNTNETKEESQDETMDDQEMQPHTSTQTHDNPRFRSRQFDQDLD